ncbi:hypothetical protein [Streptomyces endophytica]|uniref:Uncharacterized protein n=1 Tax=Streptomyces endophytica TaxID=2991496 RepID=A0ABY6P6X8_9ACTN|nr:hypothetical protein [Streptomyces endophytica]UZJ29528.1 hypothetical protein OJ254_02350 [Streptomyces endophytica]
MHQLRRSAGLMLLLLLAVTFGPLLCRTGLEAVAPAGRTAAPAAVATAVTATDGRPGAKPVAAAPAAPLTAPPVAADAGKRCSDRHAPGPDESAPLPTPHRGEPLAPAPTAGAGPLAADAPAQFALARPPTGRAPATDPTALLPVLRI